MIKKRIYKKIDELCEAIWNDTRNDCIELVGEIQNLVELLIDKPCTCPSCGAKIIPKIK